MKCSGGGGVEGSRPAPHISGSRAGGGGGDGVQPINHAILLFHWIPF